MNQFKSFHRVTIFTAAGAIAVGQNVPSVAFDGTLRQSNVAVVLKEVVGNLPHDTEVTDIELVELPLEGDYKVFSPTDFMTDEGIAYAIASILNWKSPIDDSPMTFRAGEGVYITQPFSITNLDAAFARFDPVNQLAQCMAIQLRFRIELRFDDRTGAAMFRGRPNSPAGSLIQEEDIRREICRSAIDKAYAVIKGSGWDGTVRLSMVAVPPKTIAEMAPGQQENVSILQDPPKPSDTYAAQHRPDHVLDPLLVDEPKE